MSSRGSQRTWSSLSCEETKKEKKKKVDDNNFRKKRDREFFENAKEGISIKQIAYNNNIKKEKSWSRVF
jgi:hypothetical protein